MHTARDPDRPRAGRGVLTVRDTHCTAQAHGALLFPRVRSPAILGARPWVSVGPRDPGPFSPQAGRRDSDTVAAGGHGGWGAPAGVGPWLWPACPCRPHKASVGRSRSLARVLGWVCSGFLVGPSARVWPAGWPSTLTCSFPGALMRDPSLRPVSACSCAPILRWARPPVSVLWHQARSPGPWGGSTHPLGTGHCPALCCLLCPPVNYKLWAFVMLWGDQACWSLTSGAGPGFGVPLRWPWNRTCRQPAGWQDPVRAGRVLSWGR